MADRRESESYKEQIARSYSWTRFWQWLNKATNDNAWIVLLFLPDGCMWIVLGIAAAAAGFAALISWIS